MNGVGRLVKDGSEVVGEFFADKLVRELADGDPAISAEVRRFIWSEDK
jgi:hypothetical protein